MKPYDPSQDSALMRLTRDLETDTEERVRYLAGEMSPQERAEYEAVFDADPEAKRRLQEQVRACEPHFQPPAIPVAAAAPEPTNIIRVDLFYDRTLVDATFAAHGAAGGLEAKGRLHLAPANQLAAHGAAPEKAKAVLEKKFTIGEGEGDGKTVSVEIWRDGEGTLLHFLAPDPGLVGARILFEFGEVRGDVTLADVWGATIGKVKLSVPCAELLRATPRFNLVER